MRSLQAWFDEYAESHRDPTNVAIHWVCVPAIMFATLGLAFALPRPELFDLVGPRFGNWAMVLIAFALAWYALLSWRIALGMALVTALMVAAMHPLARLPWPLWWTCAAIFAAAWIGQFVGHRIEGRKPSFLKDLAFLLVGPAWLLAKLYRRVGLVY
jgi:uncharacterized membrane protein YGL010W